MAPNHWWLFIALKFKFIRAQAFQNLVLDSLELYLSVASTPQPACTHIPCAPATVQYLLKVHTNLFLSLQPAVKSSLAYLVAPRWKRWLTFMGLFQLPNLLPCSSHYTVLLCYDFLLLRGLCSENLASLGAKDIFSWPLYLQAQHRSQICLTTCYQYFFSLPNAASISSNPKQPHLCPFSSLWLT